LKYNIFSRFRCSQRGIPIVEPGPVFAKIDGIVNIMTYISAILRSCDFRFGLYGV
jgi:hypothetical protein